MTKIEIGQVFGFWKVVHATSATHFECLCLGCNQTTRKIRKWTLLRGESKSCGCQMLALMKQTNQDKYQVDFPLQSPAIQEKAQYTLFEKYNATNAMQSTQVTEKVKKTKKIKKLLAEGRQVFGVTKYNKN